MKRNAGSRIISRVVIWEKSMILVQLATMHFKLSEGFELDPAAVRWFDLNNAWQPKEAEVQTRFSYNF